MRRTKIIATIGPASDSAETLAALMRAGLDVARLNASHSTIEELDERFRTIRSVASELGRNVATLLDLPGPKLRLGDVVPRHLEAGDEVTLLTDAGPGDGSTLQCAECEVLASALSAGDVLVIGDGDAELEVDSTSSTMITTHVKLSGPVSSRKGVTARGVRLPVPPVTEQDRPYLSWGISAGVDLIAQSFVRDGSDVAALRELLGGAGIPIIAKVELPEAVENMEAIVEQADALMVARGDLGVASAPESVPVFQKRLVAAARAEGVPVIVATQMLESMIESPRPTRAEASDVANAVFDSVDAVMLSAETAVGSYPVESVAVMSRILRLAEDYQGDAASAPRPHPRSDVPWAVSASVAEIARCLDLAAIVTATESGATARFVAAHRPDTPIVAVTPSEAMARRLALIWGVSPIVTRAPRNMDDMIHIAVGAARDEGYPRDSLVAITAGIALSQPGTTDLIHVRRIG